MGQGAQGEGAAVGEGDHHDGAGPVGKLVDGIEDAQAVIGVHPPLGEDKRRRQDGPAHAAEGLREVPDPRVVNPAGVGAVHEHDPRRPRSSLVEVSGAMRQVDTAGPRTP
jgi:hypothetical protein